MILWGRAKSCVKPPYHLLSLKCCCSMVPAVLLRWRETFPLFSSILQGPVSHPSFVAVPSPYMSVKAESHYIPFSKKGNQGSEVREGKIWSFLWIFALFPLFDWYAAPYMWPLTYRLESVFYPLKYRKEFHKGFVLVFFVYIDSYFDRLFSVNFVGQISFSSRLPQIFYVNIQQSSSS